MAEVLSKRQDFVLYQLLGAVYSGLERLDEALEAGKYQIELAPYNIAGYIHIDNLL